MKQIKTILFAFGCSFLLSGTKAFAQIERLPDEASYPVLQELAGVETPAVLLSGTWQFQYSPDSKWDKIQVPGEPAMQGYAIEHDKPFTYRKSFTVPADYAGKHTILRFDGVYSHARLFVNGTFVREHHGGFTRWETDVTPFVRPGKKNEIRLEVTDRLDDISYASGYAHHPIGGILRDVTLFALPETCLYDFYAETHLDAAYEDAVLKIGYSSPVAGGAEVAYTLTEPSGRRYPLVQSRFPLEEGGNMNELPVKNPLKWDAEHPNLYTLTITLSKDGKEIGRFDRRIGFRDVKIEKDRMLVNGMPVKLRGACRHDIHPTLGRTTTAELDSLDVILFKRSNMNFVRTSHYPPTERFLEYCDRYGIYVESETAVCFVDTYRQKNYAPGKTQDSAEFTPRYLSQCREMVKSFRSHPSILFWSIGNESVYGTNFQQCWDWVKATDKTRPVIFSYPGSVGEKKPVYDILSMHYQDVNGNLNQWNRSTHGFQGEGIPALFDEWAHPACYTYATLQEDPNIREFWGHSIERMWSGLFDAPGGLGGAIWGYVDETFMLPEPKVGTAFWKEFARTAKPEDYQGKCVGYGEWGIVDVWRREKPEFWATKKAYSPVRLMTTEVASFLSGQRLLLPLYNRFDHTDLDEIKIRYTYKGVEKEESPLGRQILEQLCENLTIAGEDMIPICQDTGMAVVFVEIGQEVHITDGGLEDAINEGVRQGYVEGYLRKSVVSDPIERVNTQDNTPAIIHYSIVPGDRFRITLAPKGFGSENMSRVVMLKPADGIEGVKKVILETVDLAGPNACPPMVIGVGVGGDFEKCAIMAKHALTRAAGEHSSVPYVRALEEEMLDKVNRLGIGPGGLGGTVTAFAVNIETYPTHIAGLPVAVNICCHVNRHVTKEL